MSGLMNSILNVNFSMDYLSPNKISQEIPTSMENECQNVRVNVYESFHYIEAYYKPICTITHWAMLSLVRKCRWI